VAAAKKITRKELLKEPDEFLTLSARALGWAARNRREINYAVTAVLAAALLASGYLYYTNRREAAAGVQFGEALAKYDRLAAGDKPKAAREVSADFRRVIDEYGGTSNGRMAALVYANLCYQAGDFSQAAELYKACLERFSDQPMIHFQILKSLGYTYEGLKDPAAALPYFERALAVADKGLQDDLLFQIGDLYARIGNKVKSDETFKRLLSEFADSPYANLVRTRVEG
jgi:tetratricopeptide (TPR) repeat protein